MATGWVWDDGGRRAAGYLGRRPADCVTRAVAIAGAMPYEHARGVVLHHCRKERYRRSNPSSGVFTPTIKAIMRSLGWAWTPTMRIGSGCTVHLRSGDLPGGRIVCSVSKHLVAVIDGLVHDTFDCTRNGQRCVYGYWRARPMPFDDYAGFLT